VRGVLRYLPASGWLWVAGMFAITGTWSFDPAYPIGPSDIAWVVEQLRKHGGRDAWEAARKLCR